MTKKKLETGDKGNWSFNRRSVADNFDSHVREQLPWYDLATGIVVHIARHVVTNGGLVYDIGAATGNIGRAIESILDDRDADYQAIDSSVEMQRVYDGPGKFHVADARRFDYKSCDLAVCFLTLMFLPVKDRREFLLRLWDKLEAGGALVVFDKVEPVAGTSGMILSRLTLAAKYEAGAKPEEIIKKELSLAGVQRPLSESDLEDLPFESIFRFGDFAGWIAIKKES